jgi:predicted CoA-binding protein
VLGVVTSDTARRSVRSAAAEAEAGINVVQNRCAMVDWAMT